MRSTESLIGLEEAAELLGYSVPGLRKIINRSRRKLCGEPVAGPTIRFFQAGRKSPIKFQRRWIEDFICEHTRDPSRVVPQEAKPRSRAERPRRPPVSPDAGGALGFDPQWYEV